MLFRGCKGVVKFFDDFILHDKTRKEHDDNLLAVLQVIRKNGLILSLDKCEFLKTFCLLDILFLKAGTSWLQSIKRQLYSLGNRHANQTCATF
jgi:hypothetical protein